MTGPLTNQAPIPLTAQDTAVGPRLFLGSEELGLILDDIFDEDTRLTNVTVNILNDAGYTVDVSFDGGSATPVGNKGLITQTLMMPDAGECHSLSITLSVDGALKHDPIIRLKRDQGGVTPTCSENPRATRGHT